MGHISHFRESFSSPHFDVDTRFLWAKTQKFGCINLQSPTDEIQKDRPTRNRHYYYVGRITTYEWALQTFRP